MLTNYTDDYLNSSTNSILEPIVGFLNQYYTIFVIAIGLIGNSITIVIFWRTKLTHTKKTSFYLISLAISDIGFLLILLFKYLDDQRLFPTFSKHSVACKLSVYFGFIFNFLSCSLIFTFTLQRLCVICFPLRVNLLNLERRAKILVIMLFIFACAFYGLVLFLYDIQTDPQDRSVQVCSTREEYVSDAERFNFLDSLFTLIIPFFGLLIMNAIIIRTLKNSSYNFIIRASSNRHFTYEPQNTMYKNNPQASASSHHNPHRYSNLPAGISAGIGLAIEENNTQNLNSYQSFRHTNLNRNGYLSESPSLKNYRSKSSQDYDYYEKDSKNHASENESVIIGNNSFVKYKCSNKSNFNYLDKSQLNKKNSLTLNGKRKNVRVSKKCHCFNCCKLIRTNDAIFSSNFVNSNNSVFMSSNNKKMMKKNLKTTLKSIDNTRVINTSINEETNRLNNAANSNLSISQLNGRKGNSKEDVSRKASIISSKKRADSTCKAAAPTNASKRDSSERINLLNRNSIKRNGNLENNHFSKGFLGRTSFKIGGNKTNSVSRKVTKMLIVVSSTFLLLNLPVHSFNVYINLRVYISNVKQIHPIEDDLREICQSLFYTSFSCNFLLYSISGVTFRTEFKRLLFKLLRIKPQTIKK